MSVKGFSVNGAVEQYDYNALANKPTTTGLSNEAKQAILACFEHVAWINEDGQTYVDALEAALYPPANLVSISAVYTQSGTVYDTDTLDSLKSDLVVTATYDNGTTQTVTAYTLSGTLTEGTSTITVSYRGKTDTFDVTVEQHWWTSEWNASDGGYPYDVDSAHWTKVQATERAISFANGNGVRFYSSDGGTFSIYPTGYETSAKSTYEIDFIIDTMPTLNGVVLRLGNGTIGMQATFGNGGVSMDNGATLISGVTISTGIKYTAKATCDTGGTCHLYLDGAEIWSGSASAIGNKKNYVMMTSTSAMDAYISRIRFAPMA